MVDSTVEPAARLRLVVGKLQRRLRPTIAGSSAGLTPTKSSVLFTVVRTGPVRITTLAEDEGLNPTMLSRVLAALQDDGLVKRTVDPLDRRAALVEATAKGKRLRERMRGERNDVLTVQLAQLSEADQQTLRDALPVLEHLAELLKDRR